MIEHSDLSFPVYVRLKEMILRNELKPGEKLLQEKLASQLGVSRTPLLKALQMLEFDFMVESIPRRGMYVKQVSLAEMKDIYDVREGIEKVAVRLVTDRATPKEIKELKKIWEPFTRQSVIDQLKYRQADNKFHSLLLEYSRNQILVKTYSSGILQLRVEQMGLQRRPEETLPEHLAIIEAIEKHDIAKAEELIGLHIWKSKEYLEKNFSD